MSDYQAERQAERQALFEKAVRGLAAQGWRRSVLENDGLAGFTCMYRGRDGRKCAIGHLLDDDKYTRGMDEGGYGLSAVLEACGVKHLDLEEDLDFYCQMQSAHDRSQSPESMRGHFVAFAEGHGLTFPEGV